MSARHLFRGMLVLVVIVAIGYQAWLRGGSLFPQSAPEHPDPAPTAEPVLETPHPALPLRVDLGEERFGPLLRTGWHPAEGTHVWSEGRESVLLLPITNDADIEMTLAVLPYPDGTPAPQRVAISLNGEDLGEITLSDGLASYSITLPREALLRRRNLVRFRYAHTARPSEVDPASEDGRELAVAWYSITFAEKGIDGADPTGP